MNTTKFRLSELLTIKNGKDYKHLKEGDIPVFGSGGYMLSVDSYLYDKDSILLPRKGSLANIQFYNKGKFWTVDTIFYSIINKELADPYYLFRYIKQLDLSGYDTGASIPSMTQKSYNGIKVYLPVLPIQQKIASILSTYDNLIENNTKRIKLLEQMAENLYKEWFAYHRIKEKSKDVKLKEIISISRGLSYSSEEIECEEGNDLVNLKNIQGYGGFRLDGTKKYCGKYKAEQIVKEGDLIMGVTDMTQDRRTVGSVALIPNVETLSVISADLIKINSEIDNIYLYSMFRYGNVSRYIAQFANGANVLHLRPQAVLNVKVTLPEQKLIDAFVFKVKPMIQMINRLNTEIQYLTRQRDLLLPRLMSGKLVVRPFDMLRTDETH